MDLAIQRDHEIQAIGLIVKEDNECMIPRGAGVTNKENEKIQRYHEIKGEIVRFQDVGKNLAKYVPRMGIETKCRAPAKSCTTCLYEQVGSFEMY